MKYGKISDLELKEFEDYHSEDNCDGVWEIEIREQMPYKLDSKFFTIIDAPFLVCHKCKSAFYAPGFEEWFRLRVARNILKQRGMLPKPLLRYLRIEAGKTQKEMAKLLGISTEEYNKFESVKNEQRRFGPDRQARLKVIFADLLNIHDPKILKGMGYIDDERNVEIPRTMSTSDFKPFCNEA